MSNVVNLNKFRKRKLKEATTKKADTNRRLHGRTKAERAGDALRKKQLDAVVDGASMRRGGEAHDGSPEDDPEPSNDG